MPHISCCQSVAEMFYLFSAQKAEKAMFGFFHLYKSEKENEKSFNYKLKGQKGIYQNIQTIWNFISGLRLSTHLIPQRLLCSTVCDSLKIIGLTYTFSTVEKISAYLYSFLYRKKIKLSWIDAISFMKICYHF